MFQNLYKYCVNLVPNFNTNDWAAMEKRITVKTVAKGEIIFNQGEIGNTVSYINKGLVRLFVASENKNISTGFLGTDMFVSPYESFLNRLPSIESMDAMVDTELFELSYESVQYLYENYPNCQTLGRIIAEQLFIFISQRSNALLLLTPEQRYLEMIANADPILQQVPQYMLASYIGVTPEHLSRIRKKMAS
jgi:CRP-like cAMP-binding protein